MKKNHLTNVILAVGVSLLMVACSAGDDGLMQGDRQWQKKDVQVTFDAYTPRSLTRAGASGDVTIADLQDNATNLGKAGFGVFGYYSGNRLLRNDDQPNFMYNQQVKYESGKWDYSPYKYWPNEHADAESLETDHVSFFAYAPYADVYRASGMINGENTTLQNQSNNSTGITSMTALSDHGAPVINYVVDTDPAQAVDLCWATASDHPDPSDLSATKITWGPDHSSVDVYGGMPWLNLTRAKTVNDKVGFYFRHALSKLNVQVDAPASNDGSDYAIDVDANTKVYLRSVSITGFAMKGGLNLYNVVAGQPNWIGYEGIGHISGGGVTFHDGRLDGREGLAADGGEQLTGLNPNFIQSTFWGDASPMPGVVSTAGNLFGDGTAAAETPIYVIPNGQPLSVTVVYDIETKDDFLPGTLSDGQTSGISIENCVTRSIKVGGSPMILQAGKAYTLRLHLGMNSVRFDFAVEKDWDYDYSEN